MDIKQFKSLPVEKQKERYLDACESLDILNEMIQGAVAGRDWKEEQKLFAMADRLNANIDIMDQIMGGQA